MPGKGGRAALGTVTTLRAPSAALRPAGGARNARARWDGTRRGTGGGDSRPSAGANNPFHGLASGRGDCKAGNPERRRLLSPLLPLVKRGKIQPAEEGRSVGSGTVASQGDEKKSPVRDALVPGVGAGAKTPARHRAMNRGARQEEEEEGGGRGLLHSRPRSEQLQ